MKCPNDDSTLQMTDRQGIEIDYCPECRGVWLDRGELDKIIERSASWTADTERRNDDRDRDRGRDEPKAAKAEKPKKKKASSFLETLMEFGGEG